ncbi:MAG: phage integrase SAM-like domain-containing protein [Verrucomicrobiales bacterium]|nr:phage integrase SAM-like domain-containing protein [Verrucomicrobiales bacterium]
MAHKPVTQATSEDMPKVPHTIIRNGTYSFNARYPQKLIDAGKVDKEFNRKSLSTKDSREARKLAARNYTLHLSEVERMESELEGEGLHVRANSVRELSAFSKAEKKDLILRWFVEQERKATESRNRYRDEDEDWKESAFDNAVHDLGVYEGSKSCEPFDWNGYFSKFLEQQGIAFNPERISSDLIELFRRAVIEVQWRTVQAFEGRDHSKRDDLFKGLHGQSEVREPQQKDPTIADICERFPKRKVEGRLSKATLASYPLPLRILEQFFSAKRTLKSLTFEDAERLLAFLGTMPTNAERRYRGETVIEAARLEAKRDQKRIMSPKRQKDTFNTIKAVLNYAVEVGWLERNPFSSKALLDKLPRIETRSREQFTSEDLTALFSHPRFLGIRGTRDEAGTLKEGRFWVPLLRLFHGMRANEAASLLVCDVKKEDGIPFLWIRETDDGGNIVKGLKTQSSHRRIPIHSELVRIGFLNFVAEQRERSRDGFLFPEMTPNKQTGNRAKTFSQWFGRLVTKALGEDAVKFGKDFHSFRHAVTDCLRVGAKSDEMRYALLGWTEGAGKRNAKFNYEEKFKIRELKELIDSVNFPGFDPSYLRREGA